MIYLIHFEKEYKGCLHYLGFCENGNLKARLKRHKEGRGSKLLRAVNKAGIDYSIVRTWDGNRNMERKLKRQKNAKRFYPACNLPQIVKDYEFMCKVLEE